MSTLLKNANVFTKDGIKKIDVLLDGKILRTDFKNYEQEINLEGLYLFPGFVDVHVHFREPGFEYKETIKTGSMAAAHGGYTAVCTMPNLNPVPSTLSNLQKQLDIIEKDSLIHIYPIGAITMEQKGRGELSHIEEIAPYVIAFSDDGKGIQNENLMREAMKQISKAGKFITAHCEVESELKPGGCINEGEYSKLHGHVGINNASEYLEVQRDIKLENLADNILDGVWLLNAFDIPFKMDNFDNASLTFAPDKNAIIRAQIQTVDKDPYERTPLDVLMQSTFMQIGSQQSYNSLTDKRTGKFNQNDKGLIEFEKTFTESVVFDKNILSVTYQTVDENARLIGYETDLNTMKKHLTDALDKGENIIIGYTQTDANNIIINGHEITIVGYKQNKDGKMVFICNDTDDDISRPIEYSEDFLLPKIHHAALPKEVVESDVNIVPSWVDGIAMYKEMKAQAMNRAAA